MDIQDIVINRVKPSEVRACIDSLRDRYIKVRDQETKEIIIEAMDALDRLSSSTYDLNWEKGLLVCLAARMHDSLISPHHKHESGWDPGDGWLVYVNLPTGQVSFHIDHEMKTLLASNIKVVKSPVWDGHGLDEKWKRIVKYITQNEEA